MTSKGFEWGAVHAQNDLSSARPTFGLTPILSSQKLLLGQSRGKRVAGNRSRVFSENPIVGARCGAAGGRCGCAAGRCGVAEPFCELADDGCKAVGGCCGAASGVCGIADDICGLADESCSPAEDICKVADDRCRLADDSCSLATAIRSLVNEICGHVPGAREGANPLIYLVDEVSGRAKPSAGWLKKACKRGRVGIESTRPKSPVRLSHPQTRAPGGENTQVT